jgi:hypothetical protein
MTGKGREGKGKGAGFLFFSDFCYSLTVLIRFFLTMKTVTINLDGQLEQQIDAQKQDNATCRQSCASVHV